MTRLPEAVQDYLIKTGLSDDEVRAISTGASGAMVYGTEKMIIKVIDRAARGNEDLIKQGEWEYRFYQNRERVPFAYLPEIMGIQEVENRYLVIVLRRYRALSLAEWTIPYQRMAADICARLHSIPLNQLDDLRLAYSPLRFSDEEIAAALNGWQDVLGRRGLWDEQKMRRMAEEIPRAALLLESMPRNFVHGDFFCHNLLWDEATRRMVLIDWQNYGVGRRGDVSFFLNIGSSWGINVDKEAVIETYIQARERHSGLSIRREEIDLEFAINDYQTDFIHWWRYLKDAPERRIAEVFGRMNEAYDCVAPYL